MAGFDSIIGITLKAVDGASAVVAGAAEKISAAQSELAEKSAAANAAMDADTKALVSSQLMMAADGASSAKLLSVQFDEAGKSMMSAGKTMTTGVTLPIVAAMGASAKMAYDFNNQMELLRTSAGIPQSQIAGLSNQVLALAGQVGQAPEKLAEGLYHIASAGNGIWSTAQMMDILKVSAEGANLGLADMDSTTYALSSTMASGIGGIRNANDAMSQLVAIVGAGDMRMQDLNAAIGTGVLATMKVAGVDMQSFGAALATLADNGESADEAATRLRMSISLMTSPSGAATKQLEALGLTAEDAKNATTDMNAVFKESGLATTKLADDLRQPNGISVAMQDLQSHLEKAGLSASETDAMLAKAFGGGRTDAALLTMLTNIDRLNDKYDAIGKSAGDFGQKVADLNKTDNQQFRDEWSAVEASFIKLGEDVLPDVTKALRVVSSAVSDFTNFFTRLSPWQKQATVDLLLFAAATGPVLVGLGAVARGASAALNIGSKISDAISAIATYGVAWTVAGAKAIASFVATSASAIANAATSTAAWIASAASSSGALTALRALAASPIVMPALVIAAALASIYQVVNAIKAISGAVNDMNAAQSAAEGEVNNANAHIMQNRQAYQAGQISKAQLDKLDAVWVADASNAAASLPGHALGTNFAPGGLSILGETGPEAVQLPTGSKVYTAKQTQQMLNGGGGNSVNIANLNINNNIDLRQVMRELSFRMKIA